jgi:nifR3 family TIM-barrel protein
MSLLKPFHLGPYRIDPPLLLAPMAGHTHAGFRTLVRELGCCGLVCSELISSHALEIAPHSRKTRELFDWSEGEHPLAVQLFGGVPEEMGRAARIVVERGAAIVDVNMGCWVPKVARKGYGAALLDDLPRATEVVAAVCQSVSVPVSVKVRIGFSEGQPTAVDFASAAARVGVSLITVHGRYARQGFKGSSDHSITAMVRQAVPSTVKVVANGDIVDLDSARSVLEQTGCDGLMLGRAALHRPWLFSELAAELCDHEVSPSRGACGPLQVARRHVTLTRALVKKPEAVLVRELRGQLLPYRLGWDGSSEERAPLEQKLRDALIAAVSFKDLDRFFAQADVHGLS